MVSDALPQASRPNRQRERLRYIRGRRNMLIPGIWGRPVRGGMPLSGKALGTGLVIRALPQAVDQTDNRERLRHH